MRELTEIVAQMNRQLFPVEQNVAVLKINVAASKGDIIEHKYHERPFVYFRRIVRNPKTLSEGDLDVLLGKALADGALTEQDVVEISLLDAVVRGRRGSDDQVAYSRGRGVVED